MQVTAADKAKPITHRHTKPSKVKQSKARQTHTNTQKQWDRNRSKANHNKAEQEFAILDANDIEEIHSEAVDEEYVPTMMKGNSSQNSTRLPKTSDPHLS